MIWLRLPYVTKVDVTKAVRQQLTNQIKVSHLVPGTPSDLINDAPVFLSSYEVKCFSDALCPKSVFLSCLVGFTVVLCWFSL